MSKQHMSKGDMLRYIGNHFDGFREEEPYMTFLGYDSSGWLDIWVTYQGEVKMLSVHDIELAA
ncbi:hypothetical protein HQ865_14875 [Mucilaginibacter mali]|uniref:Uncharacterized protein n=1 Tax=Mucilaginibacter mali TaxID=2740462 RepID=A0A7D4UPR8_9SPHI|nr:hypothetical protein [Mucilaginibacter mali]QKJ30980.1 hypothetical protein HQ865_14875 [Mucilaginibacter mali]